MPTNGTRGRPPHPDVLTPAEWRVAECVRHGLSNPQIARRCGIGIDAVKYHVGNALLKLGLPGRAELRLWPGVRNDSRLHAKEMDMTASPAIGPLGPLGPLGQIARHVRDIGAARHWYGDVLGLPHLYSFGDLAFYDCGGVRLMLAAGDGGAAESILYFRVDDVRSAHAALTGRGVTFSHASHLVHRHEDGTEEWMAFFQDNEGRPLGLIAQVHG